MHPHLPHVADLINAHLEQQRAAVDLSQLEQIVRDLCDDTKTATPLTLPAVVIHDSQLWVVDRAPGGTRLHVRVATDLTREPDHA